MYFAGADPGFSGAIAVLTKDGKDIDKIWPVETWDYIAPAERKKKKPKTQKQLRNIALKRAFDELDSYGDVILALEKVHPFGEGNNAKALWDLGGSYMAIQQSITYTYIKTLDLELCPPTKWKRHKVFGDFYGVGSGLKDGERKKAVDDYAINLVKELFPNSWEMIRPLSKLTGKPIKPNPNWADAVLLAVYAKVCYEEGADVYCLSTSELISQEK